MIPVPDIKRYKHPYDYVLNSRKWVLNAATYPLGLCYSLSKTKKNMENQEQNPLKDGLQQTDQEQNSYGQQSAGNRSEHLANSNGDTNASPAEQGEGNYGSDQQEQELPSRSQEQEIDEDELDQEISDGQDDTEEISEDDLGQETSDGQDEAEDYERDEKVTTEGAP